MPSIGDERIKADCPKCGYNNQKIEFWNCGPITYIKCPQCGYTVREGVNATIGMLFETWNAANDKRTCSIVDELYGICAGIQMSRDEICDERLEKHDEKE